MMLSKRLSKFFMKRPRCVFSGGGFFLPIFLTAVFLFAFGQSVEGVHTDWSGGAYVTF
jgi:hypothetical protein